MRTFSTLKPFCSISLWITSGFGCDSRRLEIISSLYSKPGIITIALPEPHSFAAIPWRRAICLMTTPRIYHNHAQIGSRKTAESFVAPNLTSQVEIAVDALLHRLFVVVLQCLEEFGRKRRNPAVKQLDESQLQDIRPFVPG